ncbi:hypothetical protein QAD02_021855 [Eretmocerus hayati]|uniref:Uncharacterized protein n=1 Tax=Eretmocerus hayati TaxID=131215 RepID=A0ACC2PRN8_9HYME|nr:hypothetical protein QAD02_021855 [Eretmocerus hayati]
MVRNDVNNETSPENERRGPGRPPTEKRPSIEPEEEISQTNESHLSEKSNRSGRNSSKAPKQPEANQNCKMGRPKVLYENASGSSKKRAAQKVAKLAQYDLAVLELAIRYTRTQKGLNNVAEKKMVHKPLIRHTKESAFTLYLDLDCGKYQWINPTPGSTRFCRPLQLSFEKETPESIKSDYAKMKSEMSELRPHAFPLSNGKRVRVTFEIHTTLYDGKCVNTITENPSNCRCPMCHLTQAEVAEVVKKGSEFTIITENVQFGLGLLHVNLRSLEILLQPAYKQKVLQRGWTVHKQNDKDTVLADKKDIQDKLRQSFKGVRVDQVRRGFGTSNTGNVARRLFSDPQKFSEALDLDEDMVTKISLLLRLFGCKLKLKHDKVRQLSEETHKMSDLEGIEIAEVIGLQDTVSDDEH